ncbi:MAG: anion permease, partial [Anaerolineaceae bacterium]|nr:anion permease [Anaerolineaceae bacterium]
LGGMTTLIGTPVNILLSDALSAAGFTPFRMFDFAPMGLALLFIGVVFMALVGRFMLPKWDPKRDLSDQRKIDMRQSYELQEQMLVVHIPIFSPLAGMSLAQSRLGSVLGLNVIGIMRGDQTQLAPEPEVILMEDDRLLVGGQSDEFDQIRDRQNLILLKREMDFRDLISSDVQIVEVVLPPDCSLLGKTLEKTDFRNTYRVNVLAIWRNDRPIRTDLQKISLQSEDTLLVQGAKENIQTLLDSVGCVDSGADQVGEYRLSERLLLIEVPDESTLVGKTLESSRLGEAFGLNVLGILRNGVTQLVPKPREKFLAGDRLYVEGKPDDLRILQGLQSLEVEAGPIPELYELESEQVGLEEVILSPHSTLAGVTLRQLHFREKYGLSVLAIWHAGQAYRSNLRDRKLYLGDALLLHGKLEKLKILNNEPDFLVLKDEIQDPPHSKLAPLSVLVMMAVVLSVVVGWLPISIAGVIGAAIVILAGCLSMNEAYHFIDWRSVFLIAGMLPLGIAMHNSGTAQYLAEGMVSIVGNLGPYAVVASIFILANAATQIMPNPAVAVLMAPIALNTAVDLGISPQAMMITLALSVSISLMTPVAHPSNVLIMGPGGYRFTDYIKVGLPLTIISLIATMLLLPIFWPFHP